MQHYRDDHQRILELIAEQQWLAFRSDDEGFIRAFVYSGFVNARPVAGQPGKTRLSLTRRGVQYLAELRATDRPVLVEPLDMPRRRLHDQPTVPFHPEKRNPPAPLA
ncbi:hypothetical protein [Pseudomonas sp. dw_358]|uniref:hypothetical protein n=1 Tax=Pseudomonas sp. dw_358 TaxID=2720083 RepID=UPI001BD46D88|nr:hypothetical protein [Pseudomonas sp. dw_358]